MSQRRGTLLGSVIFNLPQIFCFAKSLREPYVILMTVSLKYEVYALWVQIVSRSGGEPSSRDLILVHEFLSLRETNSVRGEKALSWQSPGGALTAFELGNGTWSVPFPDRARSLPREKKCRDFNGRCRPRAHLSLLDNKCQVWHVCPMGAN